MEHGDIVETGLPCGRGVIIDLAYGEALVLLYEGSVFDTTHGRCFPLDQLVAIRDDVRVGE